MTNLTVSTVSRTDDELRANNGLPCESIEIGVLADLIDADLEQVVGAGHASGHGSIIY